ncbi:MAG TPA: beta-ketoacyl synthase N-terminal-like domain-containing protein [Pseudonocardiaceae bacterium]
MSGWIVAGTGALNSVGRTAEETFAGLCSGVSGLSELRAFDADKFRVRHTYEIDDRARPGVDEPGRATRWLLAAIAEAVADAGIDENLGDIPVLIGTGLRELRSAEMWQLGQAEVGEADLHFGPAVYERFGASRCYTFANACSASLYALGMGTDLIDTGAADTVVVAGVDAITMSMHGLLDRVHPVPPRSVRPFDRDRQGVIMGEGAAAVVLRRYEPGQRGTADRGTLRSVSLGCDAYHVTAPDPKGIAATIRDAHTRSGVKPEDIDLVMLHGTGTLLNDEAEAMAVGEVFGQQVGHPLMTAIKSMTGHTSGGSGLLGLIVALRCLATGRIPPTIGLNEPVTEAERFRFVRSRAVSAPLAVAQVNAFGFGGVNAVAVVERRPS